MEGRSDPPRSLHQPSEDKAGAADRSAAGPIADLSSHVAQLHPSSSLAVHTLSSHSSQTGFRDKALQSQRGGDAGGRRGTAGGDSVGRMLNTDRHDGEPSANILTSRFRETGPFQIESTYTQLPAFTPSSTSRHPCCWSRTTVSRSQTVKPSNTTRTRTEVMETLPGSFIRS